MKKILLIIVGLIVVILGAAAVAPKDFKIEKSVTINKPTPEVFAYLKLLQNGEKWDPWAKMDPEMKREFKGVDGTVGATSSWSGNSDVGVGEMEIKNIEKNQKITFELRFEKPMKATNEGYFATESVTAQETKVTWGMTGRTAFPFNLICLMMHGKVEKNFEQGLNELKTILESAPAAVAAPEVKNEELKVESETTSEVKASETPAETNPTAEPVKK